MWLCSVAHQHKLLLIWTKRCPKPVTSTVCSLHATACLHSEDNGNTPVVKKRTDRPPNRFSVPHRHKAAASDGGQGRERSQNKTWKNDTFENHRREDNHSSRVSSELRKLRLEDFPEERERPAARHERKPPKNNKSDDYECVFGIAPCLLALVANRRKVRKLFVKDGEASNRASVVKVCEEALRRGVQMHRIGNKELDKMTFGRVHQGVCLQASPLKYLTENSKDFTPRQDHNATPLWLVLERIQDPMNLGAILRSAYFLGVDRVVSSLRHSCPLSPVVSKASSGVMEVFGVYGYENLEEMLKVKVSRGWDVVGTVGADADESQIVPVTECSDFEMSRPTLLLMGGEGEGLSRELTSLCQTLVTIPAGRGLFPGIESLNVSVAAGILMHALMFSKKTTR